MNTLFSFKMDDIMHVLLAAFLVVTAVVAVLAARNRLLFKLGLRNIPRRRAQSILIIFGLMLSTVIVTSAFAAGDTFSYSIRASSVATLGAVDETVTRSTEASIGLPDSGSSTSPLGFFPISVAKRVQTGLQTNHDVDGVMPVVALTAPLQDLTSRETKDASLLLGAPARYPSAFGPLLITDGATVTIGQLGPDEVYINDLAAKALNARLGDRIRVFMGSNRVTVTVRNVLRSRGLAAGGLLTNTLQQEGEVLLPLDRAQRLAGHAGQVTHVLVSNRGDELSGAALTNQVAPAIRHALSGRAKQYDVKTVKQDALITADSAGTEFTTGFVAFGLFSIVAGVTLIFLIFIMLAAERRSEMGIARAVGTKRRHLIQQFLFEGYVYDLGAALVGVVMGVGVGLSIVSIMASLVDSSGFFTLQRHIEPRSVVVAFCLGALVTFITVAISCWRVSRLTIVTAIRDLPDDLQTENSVRAAFSRPWKDLKTAGRHLRRKRPLRTVHALLTAAWHLILAFRVFVSRGPVLLAAGYPLLLLGISARQAFPFMLGVSLLLIGSAMMLRWIMGSLGVPDRVRNRIGYSLAGIALVAYWILPFDTFRSDLEMGIEMFALAGIMLTLGGVWTVMFNLDFLLSGLMLIVGGLGRLTPILKTAVMYPTQHRFRTGMTLFMFTLVIFALMVQAVLIGTFGGRTLNLNRDFGGYAVYGSISPSNPIDNLSARLAAVPSLRQRIAGAGGIGQVPVGLTTSGRSRGPMKGQSGPVVPANVADDAYLASTRFTLHSRAIGYTSDRQVWQTLRTHPGYAVVDSSLVKVRGANGGGFLPGFVYQDKSFKPVKIDMRDLRNGKIIPVTVIGVLDSAAFTEGLYTGQSTFIAAHDPVPTPITYYFHVAPGQSIHQTALVLGSAFLANGLDVTETQGEFDKNASLSVGFNNLLEGFMALGLIVCIAALGVIATRSVVERRQQIGMLRAIGFKRRMVQATFLLESSFVAILGTLVGVALGLTLGANVIAYFGKTNPSLHLVIPWSEVALIVVGAYLASLLTTYLPAWQASRIEPADALRYE